MENMERGLKAFIALILVASPMLSWGQTAIISGQDTSRRVITTAVPFLLIAPDARSGAMGDVGVATSADANSVHWNNRISTATV